MSTTVWVKRPHGRPTLVRCMEGDVVDDLKALVLQRYRRNLDPWYDVPDVMLWAPAREGGSGRFLDEEEVLSGVIRGEYPGGQHKHEAFVIQVPVIQVPPCSLQQPVPVPQPASQSVSQPVSRQEQIDYFSQPVAPEAEPVRSPLKVTPGRRKSSNQELSIEKGTSLEGMVPPIRVLIVEDNPINQRILTVFMQKRGISYEVAGDGQAAVERWQRGSFHLVLMDIQLPVKSGIEATREIREIERARTHKSFPVIIVALTASSLSSDRHEALAAGCNDYLTKPVSLVWLERKILEWGCMQALIDHQGWGRWKRSSLGSV